jgi:hypothetical protein
VATESNAEPAATFDHRALHQALEAATTALAGLDTSDPCPVEGARAAVDAVERFHDVLVRHLRSEEDDGDWFAEIVFKAPHVAAKLDVLRLEHEPFAVRMAEITEDARWAGVSRAAWQRVDGALETLAREIHRHEQVEEALAADALLVDEGGGD